MMPGNQMTVIVAAVACLVGASCMWAVAYGVQHMSPDTGYGYTEEAPPEMLMTLPPGAVLSGHGGHGGHVMAA